MPDLFNSEKESVSNSFAGENLPQSIDEKSMISDQKNVDMSHAPGHTHNPLSSYCYYPHNVSFLDIDPNEKVVLLLRRHPITNLGWILLVFVMVVAPSFIIFLTPFELLPVNYQTIVTLIWYLVTFAFAMEKFLDWFFNVNIITDERVIDVDFVNLVYREVSDAELGKIEDVSVEVGGGIRTVFGYGDLLIQTAAEIQKIEFEAIPKPDKVAKILRELRINDEKKGVKTE